MGGLCYIFDVLGFEENAYMQFFTLPKLMSGQRPPCNDANAISIVLALSSSYAFMPVIKINFVANVND